MQTVRFLRVDGDDLRKRPSVRYAGVGVGGLSECGVGERAGVDEGDGAALRDFRDMGVPVKYEPAPQLLRAEGEGEQVAFDSVPVPVREKDLNAFGFEDGLFGQREIVAVAGYAVKAFVQREISDSRRAVAQEKREIALLRYRKKGR